MAKEQKKFADKALAIDQKNAKGYYRRGEAHRLLKDYTNAKSDFLKALDIAPQDKLIRKELNQVEKELLRQEKEDAKKLARLFDPKQRIAKPVETKSVETPEPITSPISPDSSDKSSDGPSEKSIGKSGKARKAGGKTGKKKKKK